MHNVEPIIPVDHFPSPDGSLLGSQDFPHQFVPSKTRPRMKNIIGLDHMTSGSQNISTAVDSSIGPKNVSQRPSVSKNMPLCFRENPGQKQRARPTQQANNTQPIDYK